MKKALEAMFITFALLVGVLGVWVYAQGTVMTPGDSFAYDLSSPLADAKVFTHTMELDGVLRQGPLAVNCAAHATMPLTHTTCDTLGPTMSMASHMVRFRVTNVINGAPVDSEYSDPFTFTYSTLGKPTGVRIKKKS